MSNQLSTKKSEIIKKLSDNYPNFIKRDLIKLVEIIISEMKNSLKRNERIELRDVFSLEPRLQKQRIARNPKTNEKIFKKDTFKLHFKIGKILHNELNSELKGDEQ